MTIYEDFKPKKVKIFSNIDPCSTCIVKDEKSVEHCGDCRNAINVVKTGKKNLGSTYLAFSNIQEMVKDQVLG